MINLDLKHIGNIAGSDAVKVDVTRAYGELYNKNGKGNDFLGWVDLPVEITPEFLKDIKDTAADFRAKSEVLVCIGIGGSYLGTRAVEEALKPFFRNKEPLNSSNLCVTPHLVNAHYPLDNSALLDSRALTSEFLKAPNNNAGKSRVPEIIYAGHQLSEDYLAELLPYLDSKEYTICVISKSGTTTEPAIAFRILRKHLTDKYGAAEASKRIVAITDKERGALKGLATQESYKTYVIPDNVGGRYSVLTPVGLFPLAVLGVDVASLVQGACEMREKVRVEKPDFENCSCAKYVLLRNTLYRQGKKMELMVQYDPRFFYFIEWWKQLFGESEGKENKGIFPSSAGFTTDLHSLGQYIQEGERFFFETVLSLNSQKHTLEVPVADNDADGMNFVAGKRLSYVNAKAEEGTCMAHSEQGGVPVIRFEIPVLNEHTLGGLIYFFEYACGLSGYTLGVNPFNQPGVEAYKKEMFRLLGK
ncbi:MAG: glucose-6-phosphate isomerase [Bacteroidales bacterium]|jgi:glucose-6-phosphate isomerase|nr:glucose-6-phosphate isomerase [Bacteroidales bacterium]